MVENMKIPEGYKMTEVGIIPEEWGLETVENLCRSNGLIRGPFGGTLKKKFFVKKGYKVYEQKNAIYKNLDDGNYFIDSKKYNELFRFKINAGDFIVSCSGTIGRIFQIPINFVDGIINQALLKISVNNKVYDQFFYKYFEWEKFQQRIIDNTQGGAMQNLVGMPIFRKILVSLPPLQEQQTISTVLMDMDNLVTSIERLIDKKEKIKQGTMQELLTGRKRLPGFSGEWGVRKLGDIADIRTGKKNNEDKTKDGKYPFFVRSQNIEKINSYSYNGEAILIPGEGGIGSIYHYINGKFDYHQRVYKISDFLGMSGKFIYYFMKQNFNKHAMQNSVKATVDSLRLPTFEEFIIIYPKSEEEQQSIAKVLSDMDLEIEALKQKLEKYKTIKQGMMQELLTGRIRLV